MDTLSLKYVIIPIICEVLIRGDLTADIPFTCTAGALTSSQERFENFIHSHNPLLQLHFGPTELFEVKNSGENLANSVQHTFNQLNLPPKTHLC